MSAGPTIWQAVSDHGPGARLVLVVIVDRQGSAPNGPGAKMLVGAQGWIQGTVGGGASEADLVERARAMLQHPAPTAMEVVRMRHDGAPGRDRSGSICSGEQTFVLRELRTSDLQLAARAVACHQAGTAAELGISPSEMRLDESTSGPAEPTWVQERPDAWTYTESLGRRDHAVLIGGGHVSLALSEVLARLDFRITVLDNRPGLSTMTDNACADDKRVVDYASISEALPRGGDTYVSIMTYGHRHDQEVLRQLAGRTFRYLGMMGSKAKVEAVFSGLRREGVPDRDLDTVHAPIGLSIGSRTPEEIAISIAAEMIRVRRCTHGI